MKNAPIGVFDSGYGGLTVLKELIKSMPGYDFLYLGDNARTPYGTRSFDVVYQYTLQAVKYLFGQGCPLVIIACNTASAKALRNIQMLDLPTLAPDKRVLGVIRPSVEKVAEITLNGHVGVLGTVGTVISESYPIELEKWSGGRVKSTVQEACPMWVPLVENNEIESEGADYFIRKNIQNILAKDKDLDTLVLGCTHYPLLSEVIQKYVPKHITILKQGHIVAEKLVDYLQRHPEIDKRLSKSGNLEFQTTESADNFESKAALFMENHVKAKTIHF
ncbi:glutamate racemase [Prolixibacteraceae bacterium Z1-6]|uniref:Glutamate racemase n=1 Tax=Draconibacterium aestuarii TaxID=2998507 RepID=A0A9X3F3W4_9BACT|nr:glutamate racemase [Prolixibacteraceae bacterium Z1-6]